MRNVELKGLVGQVDLKLYGSDGLLREFRRVKNTTVQEGFEAVRDQMGNDTQPAPFKYCAIGDSLLAVDYANTLLGNELARSLGTYYAINSTVWQNKSTFPAGTGTGDIKESGMFNGPDSNAHTMLCRQTFATVSKGASDTLVVTWQYNLAVG